MSLFKCKICGGSLEFSEGASVCVCQYCGTQQTLPKLPNEHSSVLYERADHFRRNNDFDKAISIYEQILNENNTDAEAYWSLVLCRYGIEYVEDPKSNKRIATVNRMQYTSVLADEDYKSALKYADAEQKKIYEAEAKEIDNIQKGILAISQKEEPFDVFICYKETDNNGRRTPDSVLANELYHQLDNEGYKVFFSRITLEDKLGTAYEPYIFAALNSAKVMVVIGTKPEYFNAVWVRNEWSRFLALIKNGANKVLIPAYRDMDPYDLPEEFSHLQSQDMSKLGFMQDLIRGIEKLTSGTRRKYIPQEQSQSGANTAPLLRRVYLFLEDADWESADEYCEKVLDMDPECAEAYLGKMMVELKIRRKDDLSNQKYPFDKNVFYKKALRFADDRFAEELKGYINTINQRSEYERLSAIYKKAEEINKNAKTEDDYKKAAELFSSISGFKDADEKATECKNKANETHFGGLYSAALTLMNGAKTEEDFIKAAKAFDGIKEYKDSAKLLVECEKKAEAVRKDSVYTAAVALINGNKVKNYRKAISELEKISPWKDSAEKIEFCNNKIEEINAGIVAAQEDKKYRDEIKRLKTQERKEAFIEKLPLFKKIVLIVVPVIVISIVSATVLPKIDWSKGNVADTSSNVTSVSGATSSTVSTSSVTSTTSVSSVASTTTSKKPGTNNPNSNNNVTTGTPPSNIIVPDGNVDNTNINQDRVDYPDGSYQIYIRYEDGTYKQVSNYEKDGTLKSESFRSINGDTKEIYYFYNQNLLKRIEEKKSNDPLGGTCTYIYSDGSKKIDTFSSNGKMSTSKQYNKNGILIGSITYNDDKNSKIEEKINETTYYTSGKIKSYIEYSDCYINSDQAKHKETIYYESGKINRYIEYSLFHERANVIIKEIEYDENGNIISEK